MQKADGVKNRKIRAIIFDMDNTLFDFVEAKIRACRAVIDYISIGSEEELLQYFLSGKYGFEDHRNIAEYMRDKGTYSKEKFEECCKIYEEVKLSSIKPYPHVRETLEKLKEMGLKLAVVTDACNGNAIDRLQKTKLLHFFDVVVSS